MDSVIEKLLATWIAAGRSNDEFLRHIGAPRELHAHEEYLAGRAGVTLPVGVLALAKSLLGEATFDGILSSLKALAIEPSANAAQNPNGLFIFRVCEVLRSSAELPQSPPISAAARRAL